MVAGILLTGGQSARLGVDKARVLLDGETLAARCARALATVCSPCIEVGSAASGLRCVREEPAGQGPLAAFVCGVRAFDAGTGVDVMLLACDMPHVSVELLQCIAERPAAAVIPVVGGRAQYGCAKYGGAVLDAMCEAADSGTRHFKWLEGSAWHAEIEWIDEAVWGAFGGESAFRDVDTRDDAAQLGIRIP